MQVKFNNLSIAMELFSIKAFAFVFNLHADRVPYKNSKVSWWRRPSILLNLQGTQSKSNAVWSIALVAAFFGIVVVGYRLQRERSHNQQLKLDLYAKEEVNEDLKFKNLFMSLYFLHFL